MPCIIMGIVPLLVAHAPSGVNTGDGDDSLRSGQHVDAFLSTSLLHSALAAEDEACVA